MRTGGVTQTWAICSTVTRAAVSFESCWSTLVTAIGRNEVCQTGNSKNQLNSNAVGQPLLGPTL